MDWLLATPTIHSAFASLGSIEGDTYIVSPNALAILEEINFKLTYEDQTLRTFRRAIGFGQNVRTDLIPLLENAKDDDVFDSVVRILVNLTIPVECLFSVDVMYRTEVGRHTIFELNKLLYSSKEAFTDAKSTKCVVEFMKHILESEPKLSPEKCDQINNCLVLLRNILHVPETNSSFIVPQMHASTGPVSMQNAILWNLFIQSIDKLLLYLMSCPERAFWGVTMVQLIALIYKDQNVSTLQKLLNMWFESSLSESSEDNESNTSPPKQVSGDSSPMLMSDPTSDSSDNGGIFKNECSEDRRQALREETEATLQEVCRKGHDYQNAIIRVPTKPSAENRTITNNLQQPDKSKLNTSNGVKDGACKAVFMLPLPPQSAVTITGDSIIKDNENSRFTQKVPHSGNIELTKGKCCAQKRECPSSQSELSDCGYATQAENQESISTSSNDDDAPQSKPVHQKPPCNSKPRIKPRAIITLLVKKELRRKKLVKRSKSSLINMKGLVQHIPTDEDISNLLKEFTVDFLLKGYDCLVDELHTQLLTNLKLTIDTSHFFWLVTYFLKFAAQLELDLAHIHSILTFDMISYLTYEGVMLCEQLELNSRQEGSDLKPYLRRMHLLVTAIREFLQAIETYKKVTHLSEEDREYLQQLQVQISSAEDIRCLFVLLIRRFNPNVHTKQYLQDLVVTNHMLLLILDNVTQSDTSVNIKMIDHISQFATPEIMQCYGILLENFNNNGEFINDCIFTMMHHIGGDLGQIGTLFQPVILKTFSRIWEADYELCDDWSDLIEYVISIFINTPQKNPLNLQTTSLTELTKEHNLENTNCSWTQEEMNTLYWYYVQSKKTKDAVGKIINLISNNGNKQKSRISIIQQLLQQDIITLVEYDDLMKFEDAEYQRSLLISTSSTKESGIEIKDPPVVKPTDDFQILCDLIIKENKSALLTWLQKVLLECCYVKLTLKHSKNKIELQAMPHIMEPVAYHCILKNKSFPVVQWNTNQANTMHYQPFVLLLHKLGFQLPADAGSVFAHIPAFWTADMMFSMAKKLGPLDNLVIKFDLSLLKASPAPEDGSVNRSSLSVIHEVGSESVTSHSTQILEDEKVFKSSEKDFGSEMFAMPKAKHCNSIIRFTPDPESTPSVPNWLQLVMRSKCLPSDKYDTDLPMTGNVIVSSLSTASHMTSFNSILPPTVIEEQHLQQQEDQQEIEQQFTVLSDDDSAMISLAGNERKDSASSGFYTQSRSGSGNLDSEYSAMVASVYAHETEDDTASVTSDLTRMNVSDDEEKPEFHPDALE